MSRQYPVLIVNPNPEEHKRLEKVLSEHFEVLHAAKPEMAILVFGSIRPWAVIASSKQDSVMNGAKLSLHMRNQPGGQGCTFIVHGIPEGGKVPRDIDAFKTTWKLDLYLPSGRLRTATINRYLMERMAKLNRPQSDPNTPPEDEGPGLARSRTPLAVQRQETPMRLPEPETISPPDPTDEAQESPDNLTGLTWGELAQKGMSASSFKAILTKDIMFHGEPQQDSIDEDPREFAWTELLKHKVSRRSLKALLTKDIWIHGQVKHDKLDALTWSELFTQDFTAPTIKAILTKPIGRKVNKKSVEVQPPAPEPSAEEGEVT